MARPADGVNENILTLATNYNFTYMFLKKTDMLDAY